MLTNRKNDVMSNRHTLDRFEAQLIRQIAQSHLPY
jgi:hypothetical protein